MLAVMTASILSGLLVLILMPECRGVSFWLTVAGIGGMVGTLATTLLELPLNRQTLTASPNSSDSWLEHRPTWERFNHLRIALELADWSCLCVAGLAEARR